MRETYTDVLGKAEHFIALKQTTIFLDEKADDLPWNKASRIESGCGYRLNGPTGFYVIAEDAGLTFKWDVDFESRGANGKGYSMFDRTMLREVAMKLPPPVRRQLGEFLANEVLPGVQKVSAEWREAMNRQLDSEDCVRGLIEFVYAD